MSTLLYGSLASPYVRRIRLLLDDADYTFQVTNIYDDAVRAEYNRVSPMKKLPVMVDDGQVIYDSRVICLHWMQKCGMPALTLPQHNLVSAVDGVTDSLIILFYCKNSDVAHDADKMIVKLQVERVPATLEWLSEQAQSGAFDEWGYPAMTLVSLLQWAKFRGLDQNQYFNLNDYPHLWSVLEKHADRAVVQATEPC